MPGNGPLPQVSIDKYDRSNGIVAISVPIRWIDELIRWIDDMPMVISSGVTEGIWPWFLY